MVKETLAIKLVRLEARQEELLRLMQEEKSERRTTNRRLTSLETKVNYAAGAVAIISLGFSTLFTIIKEKLFG